jgi:hypothetical protein
MVSEECHPGEEYLGALRRVIRDFAKEFEIARVPTSSSHQLQLQPRSASISEVAYPSSGIFFSCTS